MRELTRTPARMNWSDFDEAFRSMDTGGASPSFLFTLGGDGVGVNGT